MTLGERAAALAAATATALTLWSQFEQTKLHDRLIDQTAARDSAEMELGESRDGCGVAVRQLARIAAERTEELDRCMGE